MRIAFTTANYYGKASSYETSMENWGEAERRVIEQASLTEFDAICADIAGAGFTHFELWMAHAFPKFMTPYLADEMKAIWQKHGLTPVSYSCSLGDPVRWPRWTRLCFETAKWLGIDLITSGISVESAPAVYACCREFGIRVAAENHPEKHPDEIRAAIGPYGDLIGACVDTGWFATQGFPAEEAIHQLKDNLFHIHLKDVDAVGRHQPVALGEGIVNIDACVRALRDIGYDGTLSIEQESGDHDPTGDCAEALKRIKAIL